MLRKITTKNHESLMKHKSEIIQKFIEFHILMKNTWNYNIKEVRSDNGLEYNNSNFINYLRNNEITFNHSTPDDQQQNGRSERINQTLDIYSVLLNYLLF